MKLLMLTLLMLTTSAMAQDYYWLQRGTIGQTPSSVVGIDVTDKTGDWIDYRKTGLPIPPTFPALVDASSGDMICQPTGTVNRAIRDLRNQQRQSVTNESPGWYSALTLTTNTMSLIGTNRTGFAVLRYDGTKLTAAQREQYQTECIQYLAARMQLLERELRRKRVVNVKDIVEEAP